jgi:hypothetical protein
MLSECEMAHEWDTWGAGRFGITEWLMLSSNCSAGRAPVGLLVEMKDAVGILKYSNISWQMLSR